MLVPNHPSGNTAAPGTMSTPLPRHLLWRKRLLAFAVDAMITLGLASGLLVLANFPVRHIFFDTLGTPSTSQKVLACLLGIAVTWLVYRTLAESGGRGVGKWLAGLEVEGPQGEPGIARALFRALTCAPNALVEYVNGNAPFDALIGVSLQPAPRLLPGGWAPNAWSVPFWVVLAAVTATFGLRQTPEETLWRFYTKTSELGCCGLPRPDEASARHWSRVGYDCEEVIRDLIRLKDRGDVTASGAIKNCPRAEMMEQRWGRGWP
jgi:hypothetical protein